MTLVPFPPIIILNAAVGALYDIFITVIFRDDPNIREAVN